MCTGHTATRIAPSPILSENGEREGRSSRHGDERSLPAEKRRLTQRPVP